MVIKSDAVFWIVFFLADWAAILGLISFVGGWRRLASQYPRREPIAAERFGPFASVALGLGQLPANYGNCITLQVDPFYIHLSVLFPFRPFHAPLSIPWSVVTECKREKLWWFSYAAIYLSEPKTRLLFHGRVGRRLEELWIQRRNS